MSTFRAALFVVVYAGVTGAAINISEIAFSSTIKPKPATPTTIERIAHSPVEAAFVGGLIFLVALLIAVWADSDTFGRGVSDGS